MTRMVLLILTASAIMPAQTFTEYPLPTSASRPNSIVAGPDGALWFTENAAGKIGRVTTAGAITEYPLAPAYDPCCITTGPDGALWFIDDDNLVPNIARISTSGAVTQFAMPTGVQPQNIVIGPDGALWFSVAAGEIGRMTTAGALTFYKTPGAQDPDWLFPGPNGQFWFAISGGLAEITTSGVVTQFPGSHTPPSQITLGSDGAMWAVEGNYIGTFSTAGVFGTEYDYPCCGAQSLVSGPDGALWYLNGTDNAVARMTLSGTFTMFPIPTSSGSPYAIAAGADGAMWFVEYIGNKIGRITVPSTPAGPTILAGGIVNAASYAQSNGSGTPVAPGALVAMFTSQLSAQTANFSTSTLPASLGGVSVTFNGITAPMVAVSPTGQYPYVSAQVPFEVTPGTASVVINVNGTPSPAFQESIVASQPGIFTIPATGQGNAILVYLNPATNAAAIAAPSGSNLTSIPSSPIPRGTNAFFYVTGLGEMTPAVPDGSGTCPAASGICNANAQPQVFVGGISAPVAFAGQAPGYPGVFQVNIMIPQSAPTGNSVALVVKSADGSVTSNTATIAVQ